MMFKISLVGSYQKKKKAYQKDFFGRNIVRMMFNISWNTRIGCICMVTGMFDQCSYYLRPDS